MANVDILALARAARARDISAAEQIVAGLEAHLRHNEDYLARRRRRGWQTDYDRQLSEDDQVIALAIVMLESLA